MKIQVNKQNVGLRIKQIRLDKGYTLEEFGKLFNTGKSNTRFWEQGRSLPNKERLKAIAKLGDMTVNELLYGSVEEFVTENFEYVISYNRDKEGIKKLLEEYTTLSVFIEAYRRDPVNYSLENIPKLLDMYSRTDIITGTENLENYKKNMYRTLRQSTVDSLLIHCIKSMDEEKRNEVINLIFKNTPTESLTDEEIEIFSRSYGLKKKL